MMLLPLSKDAKPETEIVSLYNLRDERSVRIAVDRHRIEDFTTRLRNQERSHPVLKIHETFSSGV